MIYQSMFPAIFNSVGDHSTLEKIVAIIHEDYLVKRRAMMESTVPPLVVN